MKKMRIFFVIFGGILSIFFLFFVYAAPTGFIGIILDAGDVIVNIDQPQNVTYNYGVTTNFTLPLNVSSPNPIQTYWYKLEDLKHNEIVYDNVIFTPNTTFSAVRWQNKLTVYGNLSGGKIGSNEVYFFVNATPSAPVIGYIPPNSLACENSVISIFFNVTNLDEDDLSAILFPSNPLFIFRESDINYTINQYQILSNPLQKSYIGNHSYNVSVSDPFYSDSSNFNISVIEINRILSVENLTVQTLYTFGENSTFYKQWYVNDVEDGNSSTGNFSFNISFSGAQLFNISKYGIMNYTSNTSHLGVHNITVCATDHGLSSIHPNISYCNVTGLNNTVCDDFSITITDDNRPPRIESYYPNLSFITYGGQDIYFNISTFDPDFTIPDVYWYFDDFLLEYDTGSLDNEFVYNYPCGSYGSHNVTALVTDGLLNTSLIWNFTVISASCPALPSGGGGGGGGGGRACKPNYGCELFSQCRNLEDSFSISEINFEDYLSFKKECKSIGLNDYSCGYQLRSCDDVSGCTRIIDIQKSVCQYTDNPNCEDNIRNCHDGSCEVLVDCGGPCAPCPTCSDGIKNQGEKGIDCGGPCPNECTIENPLIKKEELKYVIYIILFILLALLIVLVIINITRIIKLKNEIGELNWYELLKAKKKA